MRPAKLITAITAVTALAGLLLGYALDEHLARSAAAGAFFGLIFGGLAWGAAQEQRK